MKAKKTMYVESIVWWDDLCPESYKVAIPAYGLRIRKTKKIDDFSTEVVVETVNSRELKEFLDDHEEGDYRVLDVVSEKCESDADYIFSMKNLIMKADIRNQH